MEALESLGLFLHFQDLEDVFARWPGLLEMDLRGNPVCKRQKYRELLISICRSLGETAAASLPENVPYDANSWSNGCFLLLVALDGKEINEITRQFLINWRTFKETNRRQTAAV